MRFFRLIKKKRKKTKNKTSLLYNGVMKGGFLSTVFLLFTFVLLVGSSSLSLSKAYGKGKRDITLNNRVLKLQDLMPPFQYEKEDPLFPKEVTKGRLPASIQFEEEEDQFYKDRLQKTFEALEQFQGNY